jgi:predicted ATPase
VQLFVERVTEVVEDFALTDANAPLVVEICQRLDKRELRWPMKYGHARKQQAAADLEVSGIAHDALPSSARRLAWPCP